MHSYSFNDNNAINNALLHYKNLVMPIFRHFLIKLKSFFFRTPNAIFRLANNNTTIVPNYPQQWYTVTRALKMLNKTSRKSHVDIKFIHHALKNGETHASPITVESHALYAIKNSRMRVTKYTNA